MNENRNYKGMTKEIIKIAFIFNLNYVDTSVLITKLSHTEISTNHTNFRIINCC